MVGGAGHVGIPLVLSFAAKGMTVNVNDTNEAALNILRSGRVLLHRRRRRGRAQKKRSQIIFCFSPASRSGISSKNSGR